MNVFSGLGGGKNTADTAGVAVGIAEALNTTIFGLAIAIPTLIAYTYFTKRVEVMSVEMESLMADLLSKCYYQRPVRGNVPAAGVAEAVGPVSVTPGYAPQARRISAAPVSQPMMEPDTDLG